MKPSRSVSCQSCSALHDNGTKICSHCYSRVRPWGRPKGTTRKAGYKIGDNGLRKGPTRKAGYKVGCTGGRKGATREAGYEVGGAAVPQGQKRKLTVMADETQGSVPGTMLTPSTVSPPVTNPPLPAQVSTAQPIIAPPLSRMVPPPSSSISVTIDQLTTLRSALLKQQWIQEQIDQPKMPARTTLTTWTVSPPVTNPLLHSVLAQVSTGQPITALPPSHMVPPPSISIVIIDQLTTLRSALPKQQQKIRELKYQPKMPANLPTDIRTWSIAQVVSFFRHTPDCNDYAEIFQEQAVDGTALLLLTHESLVKCLGIKLGQALKIMLHVELLRSLQENQ